jgi:2'-hydroxyisoflavone reductase
MKILFLGGTLFLGRHTVQCALERGHEPTLFNRGRTGTDLFPGVERLVGDRAGDVSALRGRSWDAVVDLSAFGRPWEVRRSAEVLRDAVDHYAFISSLSVYLPAPGPVREDHPLRRPAGPTPPPPGSFEAYAELMVFAEGEVEEAFPGRALLARTGNLVGPYDPVDRYFYWLSRAAEGGEVLAPGRPERRIELLDARDAAEWLVKNLEARTVGPFNLVGPPGGLAMGEWLEGCAEAAGSGVRFTWVDDAFLVAQGVKPWIDLPYWEPEGEGATAGAFDTSIDRALATGLACRPPVETARDTLAWDRAHPDAGRGRRMGMNRERERELLDAWHRSRGAAPTRASPTPHA